MSNRYTTGYVVDGTTISHQIFFDVSEAQDNGYLDINEEGFGEEEIINCVDEYGDDLEGKDWNLYEAYEFIIDYYNMLGNSTASRTRRPPHVFLRDILIEQGVSKDNAERICNASNFN